MKERAWPAGCKVTYRVLKSGKVSFKLYTKIVGGSMEASGRADSVEEMERTADLWFHMYAAKEDVQ